MFFTALVVPLGPAARFQTFGHRCAGGWNVADDFVHRCIVGNVVFVNRSIGKFSTSRVALVVVIVFSLLVLLSSFVITSNGNKVLVVVVAVIGSNIAVVAVVVVVE